MSPDIGNTCRYCNFVMNNINFGNLQLAAPNSGHTKEFPGTPGDIFECLGVGKECPEYNHVSYKQINHCKNTYTTPISGF